MKIIFILIYIDIPMPHHCFVNTSNTGGSIERGMKGTKTKKAGRVQENVRASECRCPKGKSCAKVPFPFQNIIPGASARTKSEGIRFTIPDVPEHEKEEEALLESGRRFRELADLLHQPVFETDETGRLTFANRRAFETFGYRPEDFDKGISFFHFVAPGDQTKARENYRRIMEGEKGNGTEYVMQKKDGSTFPVMVFSSPVIRQNEIVGIRGIVVDISKSKRTEEALLIERERLEAVTQSIGAGLAIISKDYRTLWSNKVLKDLFGDVEDKICHVTYNQRDKICPECGVREIFEKGKDKVVHEQSGRDIHGNKIWSEIVATPIKDEKGNITSALELVIPITERKRAEESLRKSEARFQELFDEAPVGYHEYDIEGRVMQVNRTELRMLGYSLEEMMGQLIWNFTAEKEEAEKSARAQLAGTIPAVQNLERTFRRKDGTTFPALIQNRIFRNSEGRTTGIRSILQDISEIKKMEAETKRLAHEDSVLAEIGRIVSSTSNIEEVYKVFAEKVRELIDFDRIGLGLIDFEKNMVKFPYIEGCFVPGRQPGDVVSLQGTATEKVLQAHAGIIIALESEEEIAAMVPGLLPEFRCGIRSTLTIPLISRDQVIGTLALRSKIPGIYTERDLKLAENIGNQIAGTIASAQLLSRLTETEESLRRSEGKFRDLYDHAPLGYHEYDMEGRIASVNRTELEILGYTAEEMIGQYMWKFDIDGEAARERILAKLRGILPPDSNLERTYRKKDGTSMSVLCQDRLILDERGKIRGIRCIIQDITERKETEKEKAVLQDQLRQAQKMEAIGTLAGGIAHDFNNILTAILGYAELASLALEESSKAKHNLENSMKAAHRAKDLVQQILTFSRQGKQERKLLNIKPIIKEGLKFLRASLPATIAIHQKIEDDLGLVMADPTEIHQVLMNLCTNAAHAMDEIGGDLGVFLGNFDMDGRKSAAPVEIQPGPYVRLRVSDTGRGMPPGILSRIFDPYFTTKGPGKGTGLGLAVVHGIVKGYGGEITVSSEVGKGSTFDIYFPRIEAAGVDLGSFKAEPLPLGGNERVLFVDDEKAIADVGREILGHLGYEVTARTSSIDALELFREKSDQFDLVVTDMTMPNMSGDKLAQELLKIRRDIPIILCTGFSEHITEDRAKVMGIRGFVMKPMGMQELSKAIRSALDSRRNIKISRLIL